ncbi:MAG TPA: hemerythrin domain-containing protein [Acidimicrobiales bacterium]|nr:hemerythrin domain-containing protein [Acidimicrobiales bacterium]
MTESTSSIPPDTSDMAAVHEIFRSSLASAPAFVGSAAGDDDRRALIAGYYANVMAFLEVHHDGEEALLFPLLIERAPADRKLVDVAIEQHEDVVARLAEAKEAIAAWSAQGDSQGPELVHALGALDDVLSPHLDNEEATVVPLAGEYVTVEEWGMLPGHGMANFTGDKIWLILGLIRENFTPEQRAQMLEHMPPPAREMWETMGESSFNDMIAEVRRAGSE